VRSSGKTSSPFSTLVKSREGRYRPPRTTVVSAVACCQSVVVISCPKEMEAWV